MKLNSEFPSLPIHKNPYRKMFAKLRNSLLRHGRIFIRTCPCRHKDASLFQKRHVVHGIKKGRFLVRNAPLFAISDVDMTLL